MVMYANKVETKEKEKLPEIKNKLQHIRLENPYVKMATCTEISAVASTAEVNSALRPSCLREEVIQGFC